MNRRKIKILLVFVAVILFIISAFSVVSALGFAVTIKYNIEPDEIATEACYLFLNSFSAVVTMLIVMCIILSVLLWKYVNNIKSK